MNDTKHYLRRIGKAFYVNNFHILSCTDLSVEEKEDLLINANPDKTRAGARIAISCFELISKDYDHPNHLKCLTMCFNSQVLSFDLRKEAFVLFLELNKQNFLRMIRNYGNEFAEMINQESLQLLN